MNVVNLCSWTWNLPIFYWFKSISRAEKSVEIDFENYRFSASLKFTCISSKFWIVDRCRLCKLSWEEWCIILRGMKSELHQRFEFRTRRQNRMWLLPPRQVHFFVLLEAMQFARVVLKVVTAQFSELIHIKLTQKHVQAVVHDFVHCLAYIGGYTYEARQHWGHIRLPLLR